MWILDEDPKYKEKEFELIRCGRYNKLNCYRSREVYENETLIKGIYIWKRRIIGQMPENINVKLVMSENLKINSKVLQNLWRTQKNKYITDCMILNDKYLFMFGLFYFTNVCKEKGINNHLRYGTSKILDEKIVENAIFHKRYLREMPAYLYYELKWEYKEPLPEIKNNDCGQQSLEIFDIETTLKRVYE